MRVNIGLVAGNYTVRVSTELPDKLLWVAAVVVWNAVLNTDNAPAMMGRIVYNLSKHVESFTVHTDLDYVDYSLVVNLYDKRVYDSRSGSYTFADIETWCAGND
jgi:hypothetical protein